ncbi:MAG: hypothetical protein ABIN94_09950 [Ferruginibacter sp.]
MKRFFLLMLAITGTLCTLEAQKTVAKQHNRLNKFHSFNTLQILNGSSTTSVGLTTVNGLQFGKLFAGVGTGFDYYYHRSVPLFIEARLDLVKRKGKLQLFGNGGLSFPFSAPNTKFEFDVGSYKTGSMYGAGLDYLAMIKKEAIILGVGFNNKTNILLRESVVWNPIINMTENIPVRDNYSLNRIALRIGWMF